MKPAPFIFSRPASLDEAVTLLADEDSAAVAGGQSLLPMMGLRVAFFERLVDVTRLAELAAVRETRDGVFLGAATTHAAIEDGKVPDPSLGLMRRAAGRIAYRAVRNRGTIGGSMALADPAADWPPCLVALGATMVLAGRAGERRVAAADFVQGQYLTALDPGEIITGIDIPRLPDGSVWGYGKHSRKSGAFADSIAIVVRRPDGHVEAVLGATTSHAQRLPRVAERLAGDWAADEAGLREAAAADLAEIDPDADGYRRRCHLATILSAVRETRP